MSVLLLLWYQFEVVYCPFVVVVVLEVVSLYNESLIFVWLVENWFGYGIGDVDRLLVEFDDDDDIGDWFDWFINKLLLLNESEPKLFETPGTLLLLLL